MNNAKVTRAPTARNGPNDNDDFRVLLPRQRLGNATSRPITAAWRAPSARRARRGSQDWHLTKRQANVATTHAATRCDDEGEQKPHEQQRSPTDSCNRPEIALVDYLPSDARRTHATGGGRTGARQSPKISDATRSAAPRAMPGVTWE